MGASRLRVKEIEEDQIDLIQLLIVVQRLLRANEKREKGEVIKLWQKEAVFIAANR